MLMELQKIPSAFVKMPVDPDVVPWETMDQALPTGKQGFRPHPRSKQEGFPPLC
jgi:hypothetical protein